ncbi:TMV resistance protein Y3 [Mycena vulgaris]|nr:TMV resistance protein Y3 [Mycena vulgaris]
MYSLLSLALIAMIAAPALGQLQLNCFGQDLNLPCATFIPQFCNSIGNSTIMTSDTIQRCFNVPGGQCDFTAANLLKNAGSNPSVQNCNTALTTVSRACPSGGSGQFTGAPLRFWMDPNSGKCGIPEF